MYLTGALLLPDHFAMPELGAEAHGSWIVMLLGPDFNLFPEHLFFPIVPAPREPDSQHCPLSRARRLWPARREAYRFRCRFPSALVWFHFLTDQVRGQFLNDFASRLKRANPRVGATFDRLVGSAGR